METKNLKIGIYHTLPGEPRSGYMRVAEITLDDSGCAHLHYVVELDTVRDELNQIVDSVGIRRLNRRVSTEEGSLFIEAIQETLVRDSYWRIVDESVDKVKALITVATQLAKDAAQLLDLAIVSDSTQPLVERLKAHSQVASWLRDDVAKLLTDNKSEL